MVVKHRTLGTLLAASVLAIALVSSTGVASAGGSNWTFPQSHYEVGDTAFAWASVAWEHDAGLGTPEDGPYYAWIVRPDATTTDGRMIPDSAIQVAELAVSLDPYDAGGLRFGPHHAEVTFTVPDLPPGEYRLLHSNAAGTTTLGDITLGIFWIDSPASSPPAAIRSAASFAG
jgi:hypothetical protein